LLVHPSYDTQGTCFGCPFLFAIVSVSRHKDERQKENEYGVHNADERRFHFHFGKWHFHMDIEFFYLSLRCGLSMFAVPTPRHNSSPVFTEYNRRPLENPAGRAREMRSPSKPGCKTSSGHCPERRGSFAPWLFLGGFLGFLGIIAVCPWLLLGFLGTPVVKLRCRKTKIMVNYLT
jgi:hypothetical protein